MPPLRDLKILREKIKQITEILEPRRMQLVTQTRRTVEEIEEMQGLQLLRKTRDRIG